MNTPTDKTILLTGFEPFGKHEINPTELIVRELDGEVIGGCKIKGLVLPVVFGDAGDILIKAIKKVNPGVVLCLGLAADRMEISIERLAVNLDDAEIPDNAGNQPVDQMIDPDGPAAYWSTLPIKEIAAALKMQNIPASVSMSAGTFVCNHVYYKLMLFLADRPKIKGGFVHFPLLIKDKETDGGLNNVARMIVDIILDREK